MRGSAELGVMNTMISRRDAEARRMRSAERDCRRDGGLN
jgi:hypothetical protein